MGSVGKQIGGALGIGGDGQAKQMGNGGSFAMTAEAKQGEQQSLKNLMAKVNGQGQYVTDLQYKQAMDDMMKNNASMAASSRGVSNPGLQARNAMQASQQGQLDIARQSAAAKLDEQNQAQQMILGQANSQRGTAAQSAYQNQQAQIGVQNNNRGFVSNLGASAAEAFSDENLKKDIKPGGEDASKVINEFLGALKAHTYEYKHKSDGGKENPEGEVTSVMAQELEKSEVGKRAVKDTPAGKEVDYAQLMAPMLASMAELNKRMKNLEK